MQGIKEDLLRDIESYTCGETPSAMDLARAPNLDNWKVAIRSRGKEFAMVVIGVVTKHREIPDGSIIASGAVVWMDRHYRWIRTNKSVWSLGWQRGSADADEL